MKLVHWLAIRPWPWATLWLAGLAPFFYWSYGLANTLASAKAQLGLVPSVVFDWERSIPFLEWTIAPYWTINFFYGLSLFLARNKPELHAQALRLLTAQLIAVTFFIVLPLRFSFGLPQATGVFSFMYDALRSFDKPFNQAPSLHIALAMILWDFYRRQIKASWAMWVLHIWTFAICASVLTTYQHHFIDIPTGALLGLFCLWVWPMPEDKTPLQLSLANGSKRLKLGAYYAVGAALTTAAAILLNRHALHWGLWLLWPALSLALVAANYWFLGASGFQSKPNGTATTAGRWLHLPYRFGAWLNSRLWTKSNPNHSLIFNSHGNQVWIGRHPSASDWPSNQPVLSLSAELHLRHGQYNHRFAWLDLITPSPEQLREAANVLQELQLGKPVLVSCALGYSRSVAVVATWLMRHQGQTTVQAALAKIQASRPWIVVSDELMLAIKTASNLP